MPTKHRKTAKPRAIRPKRSPTITRAHRLLDDLDVTMRKVIAAEHEIAASPQAKRARAEARALAKKAQSRLKKIVAAARKRRTKR